MINRKSTFFLGVFIFLIPFLGLPTFWKTFFIILSGAILVSLSIKVSIPKRVSRSKIKKEKTEVEYLNDTSVYTPSVENMTNTFSPSSHEREIVRTPPFVPVVEIKKPVRRRSTTKHIDKTI